MFVKGCLCWKIKCKSLEIRLLRIKIYFWKNIARRIEKSVFLQPQKRRGVAQLVARYVRDVEAGSSSLLTPTNFWQKPGEMGEWLKPTVC